MLNLLKTLRYLVFVLFVICNAIVISVAVWNLSIIELVFVGSTAKEIDGYLIFLGASGLLLTFIILFFELCGKDVFLSRVWFELLWVGLFCIMNLVGAAVITTYSSSQTCDSTVLALLSSIQDSPCASSQVLQAFTWISAILLLGYLTLLFVLTIVKRREDSSIWHYDVRKFPLEKGQALKSAPPSPSLPRFRAQSPVIAAPRPRRIAAIREAILSYRSGLSLEYDIEHYQTPDLAPAAAPAQRTQEWTALPEPPSPPAPIHAPVHQQPIFSTPFYHTSVQLAIEDQQPQPPPPALQSQIRRLPPSPPPLGDWPRLDAASRPRTEKRKPLPQPLPSSQVEPEPPIQSRSRAVPRLQPQLQPHHSPPPRRQSRSRPQPSSQSRQQPVPPLSASIPTSASYTFDAPALSAALQPLASQPTSWKSNSRPSGPRRPSDSINGGRPPPLDLSNISSFRSPGFR